MNIFQTLKPTDAEFIRLVKGSASRKAKADRALSYYSDEQSAETLRLIAQRWRNPQQFRVFPINVVKKIVNKRANLYRVAPRRTFTGMDQKQGEALYRAANADVVLKQALRYTKLLKSGALHVGWRDDHPTLSVVTPNILDVGYDDPEHPERVIVTHRGGRPELDTYGDWTATTYTRRDYRGHPIRIEGNPGNVNPYGRLPFVPLFDRHPDDEFFLPGGDDLIEGQEAINVALSNLWRAVELQAHGQAWATGISAGEALTVGPDRAITLPQGGQFGFATPNAPIEEILQALEWVMRQLAATNDVSADVFDLDRKSESGAAKHLEQVDLKEARLDDVDLWRGCEARLWDVLKTVANTHRPGTVPADAQMRVDFAEMTENLSESERLLNARAKVELGVWSAVDVLRAENPDGYPTREDAERELLRRKAESQNLTLEL